MIRKMNHRVIFKWLVACTFILHSSSSIAADDEDKWAVICSNKNQGLANTLRVYDNDLNSSVLSPTSLDNITHAISVPEEKKLIVLGTKRTDPKNEADTIGILATYQGGMETILKVDGADISGYENLYIAKNGAIFLHSIPCECCIRSLVIILKDGQSQIASWPTRVVQILFNYEGSELILTGPEPEYKFSIQDEGKNIRFKATIHGPQDKNFTEFETFNWPNASKIALKVNFEDPELPILNYKVKDLRPTNSKDIGQKKFTKLAEGIIIPYSHAVRYPLYGKCLQGSTFALASRESEDEYPIMITILKQSDVMQVVLPEINMLLDFNGNYDTLLALGRSKENKEKSILYAIREGEIQKKILLDQLASKLSMTRRNRVKLDSYPKNFYFEVTPSGDIKEIFPEEKEEKPNKFNELDYEALEILSTTGIKNIAKQ